MSPGTTYEGTPSEGLALFGRAKARGLDGRMLLSLLLVGVYLLLIAGLVVWEPAVSSGDPVTLFLLNGLFLGLIPVYVSSISLVSFRQGGSVSTLLLGAGMLFFAFGAVATGVVGFLPDSTNLSVTIFNLSFSIGAAFQLTGALAALTGWNEERVDRRSSLAATVYAGALIVAGVVTIASLLSLTPQFFVDGAGSTPVRDLVLAATVQCALLASGLFFVLFRKRREKFFFWYGVGLALLGLGLLAVALIVVFGDLLNWVARAGQFAGACYILAAFMELRRRASTESVPVQALMAAFFAEAEAEYRLLVETAGDAIIVLGPDGRVLFWNRAAERLFGYSRDEVTGRPFADFVSGGLAVPATANAPLEREARRRDGRLVPIELSVSRREIGGHPVTTCIVHDLSERNQAEEALRRSGARQGLLAEVAARLLAADEPQEVVEDLCRRALAVLDCDVFFNYLADETSGRLLLNASGGIPGEEADRIRWLDYGAAVCGCVARDGCRVVAEAILDHPDPRTDLVAGYGVRAYACHPIVVGERTLGTLSFGTRSRDRFTDDELATMQAVATLIAIALQRLADRDALMESEERLRMAQEGAAVGVWDWDVRTGRQSFTPQLLGLYGLDGQVKEDRAALQEYDVWRAHVHPEDVERMEAERNDAIERGEPFALEFRVVHPSGAVRWLASIGRGHYDADGRLVRVLGINMDITARKEAEAELARFAADLARSNEELQRFAYVASHDLQEPLRSIVSFSQLLERRYRGQLGEDADEYIQFIVDGGRRMQSLILDLLQVSRVETQARPPELTDAGRVAADALTLLNGQVRSAGATVTIDPLPMVMTDGAQLEQVFVNLVGNAVKYRREGVPPVVRISARRTGRLVEFAVQDNGIGIEAEYFARIFEMFRRLHTREKYDGTGIGLAVMKKIVERHGGRIWVESEPGVGSTFFFTLPACEAMPTAVTARADGRVTANGDGGDPPPGD